MDNMTNNRIMRSNTSKKDENPNPRANIQKAGKKPRLRTQGRKRGKNRKHRDPTIERPKAWQTGKEKKPDRGGPI